MPRFYVNLDHVATIRQARRTPYPSVFEAARIAEASGQVDGITLHLREDRRHVADDDMEKVSAGIELPFNFEMSVAEDIVRCCERLAPAQATLVPERREELTTEGGLDLEAQRPRIAEVIDRLGAKGCAVSLFIDPDPKSIAIAEELKVPCIELHTGAYANAATSESRSEELERLKRGAILARTSGLVLNAGHGLTVDNVAPIAALPEMNDLNIGHAVVADALFLGLEGALKRMRKAIASAG